MHLRFSFQSDLSHQLDDKLGKVDNFQAWKYMISLKENELDTYISREVPVPYGDEAQSLTQEELDQGQEDHCSFNHGATCTTSVFPKDTGHV